ncbi:EF-hand domain-containing protein, partial [archaeon]
REFKEALRMLKVDMRTADIDLLFERFDQDRSGELDYKEFLELIGMARRSERVSAPVSSSSSRVRVEVDAILQRIRRGIEEYLGPGSGSARKVKEVFADIDRNGNSRIDQKEFREAMSRLRVNLSSSDIDMLFQRYDLDRSGEIDYKEFLQLLGLEVSRR